MHLLKSRWASWSLLVLLCSRALSAPESCGEMGGIFTASEYGYTVECDTSLNNPIIYSTFYLGDTFAQCIMRCDIDSICTAVLFEDLSGNCYLAADYTSTSPSNSYDVARKGPPVSAVSSSLSETSSASSTTEVPSISSTSEISSSEISSSEVHSASSTSEISSTLTTSSSPESTFESTSTTASLSLDSTIDSTTTSSLYFTTASEATTSSQASITSDQSTTETSTTVQTSTISTLATVITSQGTESILSSSGQFTTQIESTTTSTDTQSSPITTIPTSELSTLTSPTPPVITTNSTSTSKSGSTTNHNYSQTVSCSSTSAHGFVSSGSETLSASDSTTTTSSTPSYTIRTVYQTLTKDLTYTKTVFAETVTTATYLTVDQSNLALVSTCVPVTLLYSPCYCEHQVYPSLAMTTIISPCSACGSNGENAVTLTVPKAACETGSGRYSHPMVQFPHGWTGEYRTDQNGDSYLEAQFTAESQENPQGGPRHTYTNGQPSIPTSTAESYSDSRPGNNGHLSSPISTEGSQSNLPEDKESYPQESAQPDLNGEPHPTHGDTAQVAYSVSRSGNRVSPPLSSATGHGQEGFSTSLMNETATNSEVREPKSTASLSSTGSGSVDAPDTTPIGISGAHRPQAIIWTMVAAMVGTVLLLK